MIVISISDIFIIPTHSITLTMRLKVTLTLDSCCNTVIVLLLVLLL